MQTYIGTKIIKAKPSLFYDDANKPGRDGYHVVYPDGYESWSPKDVFEAAYRPCNAMTFGLALDALKLGKKVRRAGWNGKGMWLKMIGLMDWTVSANHAADVDQLLGGAWIGIRSADDCFYPWSASQADMLAEDWGIVEGAR